MLGMESLYLPLGSKWLSASLFMGKARLFQNHMVVTEQGPYSGNIYLCVSLQGAVSSLPVAGGVSAVVSLYAVKVTRGGWGSLVSELREGQLM